MHTEPWQVFASNGEPVGGKSASREAFAHDPSLIMAASHVWIWRRINGSIEVLLQKRSATKSSWPSSWDISVTGHVDAGETFVQTAAREVREEVGLVINPNQLFFAFSLRTPLDKQELDRVYLYELADDPVFHLDDGEVEELKWVSLDAFEDMTHEPGQHQLVPQGNEYFAFLILLLKRCNNDG